MPALNPSARFLVTKVDRLDLVRLSKQLAYILRHAPWEYELELDDEGWVPVEHLLDGLRTEPGLADVSRSDIEAVNQQSEKPRYELRDDRIRALYGHSTPGKLRKERATPPDVLYHGTSYAISPHRASRAQADAPAVRSSVDRPVDGVCRRTPQGPARAILTVDSAAAHAAGVVFYVGNQQTWLADEIVPEYIRFQQFT